MNLDEYEIPEEGNEKPSKEEAADRLNDLSGFKADGDAISTLLGEIEDGGFESLNDESSEEVSSVQNSENSEKSNSEKEKEGAKLDSEGVVIIADVILSRVFKLLADKVLKKETTPTSFALTKSEKEVLKEPVQRVLDQFDFSKMSPTQQLAMVILPIYGAKFISLESQPKDGESKKSSGKKGRGRRAHLKDEKGNYIEPRRYEDTGELVEPEGGAE